jgi:quercetin dioxygenase-like cupin family protein
MPRAIKHIWNDIDLEEMSPTISRKLITLDRLMLAQVFLKTGAIVPAHEHHNEQGTYIVSGCLRFWLGAHADAPGDEYVDIHAGEVLMIPGGVRHRAEALEDTLDLDVFTPPREDWLTKNDAYLRGTK